MRTIFTRADLINMLHAEGARGLSREYLLRQGLVSIGAVAAELRRAGYEVVIRPATGNLVLLNMPAVGNKRRKEDWMQLFEDEPEKPKGTYDPDD